MDNGTLATAVGDLFEIVYFHQAGKVATTFYVAIEAASLQVNQETALSRSEQTIPFAAIDSLVWGRENLLYVNWRDGDQFRQTPAMGTPPELSRLADELRAALPGLRVDESSRSQTEGRLMRIGLIALLILFLPVIFYGAALYLGYVDYLPYAGPSDAVNRP